MGAIKTVALIVLGISFFVFVVFFGRLPALRNTPISALYKLICIRIPNAISSVDQTLTSGRVTGAIASYSNYVMYDRHPTVVIFFVALLVGAEGLYLPQAWPMMAWYHRVAGSITLVLPYVFLYLAVSADPGYITKENHAYHMSLFPYDYSIFSPGQECTTCGFLKPPRSKHCSICKHCIAKADHHCIFINGCVGYGNHHWFLCLLLATATLTSYGALLGLSLLAGKVREEYPIWSFWPPQGMDLKDWLLIVGFGFQDNVAMGAVTLLAGLTSPLVWGLLGYTTWLVYCGTTTNESLKWSEWKEDMDDGVAFKRTMPDKRKLDTRIEVPCHRWPLATQQVMARTDDGQPPEGGPGEGVWEQVWKIRDIENLYDMGFWDNLMDIFVKDYAFGTSRELPAVEDQGRLRKNVKHTSI